MPSISVLLAVHRVTPLLGRAVACIRAQTYADFELLIIANGPEATQSPSLEVLAASDLRIRVHRLERASLAAALNHGLRVSTGDLVARMDADDWCAPERLRLQMLAMAQHPEIVAMGTAFEIVDGHDRVVSIERPPRDPREANWRLCLSNCFAHGSMMMRKAAIMAAGGYDERLDRAQDYDLWLRLRGRIAAVGEVLYRYTMHEGSGFASDACQAHNAAACMVRAWADLPRGDPARLAEIIAGAMGTREEAVRAQTRLATLLTEEGPTCDGLMAWLMCERGWDRGTSRAEQEHILARAAAKLSQGGVSEVYLWGAGAHTAYAMPRLEAMGIVIRGIIDDALGGQERFGRTVKDPAQVEPGSHVLISSDRHERAMWEASPALRCRGVVVHRIYH